MEGESTDVDAILQALGRYGKWQIYQFVLVSLAFIPVAFQYANIVFIGYVPSFECDDRPNDTFLNNSVSQNVRLSLFNLDNKIGTNEILSENQCDIWDSIENSTRPCETSFRYDAERQTSIVSEWDLVCHLDYLPALSQVMLTVGGVFGSNILVPLADRYGRKKTIVTCHCAVFVVSTLIALSPNIFVFIVGRFLLGFLHPGVFAVSNLLLIEVFPKSQISSASVISTIFWSSGIVLLCPIAYWFRDDSWRYLQLSLSMASLILIVQILYMDESVRWLFAVNRKREAILLIKKAAVKNNIDYMRKIRSLIVELDDYDCEIDSESFHERVQLGTTMIHPTELGYQHCTNSATTMPAASTNDQNNTMHFDRADKTMPARTDDVQEIERFAILCDDGIPPITTSHHSVDGPFRGECKTRHKQQTGLPKLDYKTSSDAIEEHVANCIEGIEVCVKGNYTAHQHNETQTIKQDVHEVLISELDTEMNTEPQLDSTADKVDEGNSMLILFRHRQLRILAFSVAYLWMDGACLVPCCFKDVFFEVAGTQLGWVVLSWTVGFLVYFGLLLLSPALAGNRFINVGLNGAIEIPAYLFSLYALNRFNRKTCILWSYVFTGGMLAAATIVNITTGSGSLVTALTTLGKMGGSGITAITFLYGFEVFPTSIRGRAVGFCNGASKIGMIIAPLSNYLALFGLWIPTSVFVVLCLSICILFIFLPETRGKQLPQTISDL